MKRGLMLLAAGLAVAGAIAIAAAPSLQNPTATPQAQSTETAATTRAGLVAAVDKDGNLTTPSPEKMQEITGQNSVKKADKFAGQKFVPIDPKDPSKGYLLHTPNFRVSTRATIGADGKVHMSCTDSLGKETCNHAH